MRVLSLLVDRAGKPVDRKEIRSLLWGDSTFVDYDVGVDYCIYRIRTVLGDKAKAPRYIETLPGRGYRCERGWLLLAVRIVKEEAGEWRCPVLRPYRGNGEQKANVIG